MTLAVVLVALALAPVLRGVSAGDELRDPMSAAEQASVRVEADDPVEIDETLTCDWACQACEPDQGCQQVCIEIGDCGSTCGAMARCDAQHVWSDDACACVMR